MNRPDADPNELPDYCCAIITDARGQLLLQVRPATARHAANLLTCFGGRRESHESMLACLARELAEELGWRPLHADVACDLWQASTFIARFFRLQLPTDIRLRTEPGHCAIWAPMSCLSALPVSPWHQTVFHAVANGQTRAEIST